MASQPLDHEMWESALSYRPVQYDLDYESSIDTPESGEIVRKYAVHGNFRVMCQAGPCTKDLWKWVHVKIEPIREVTLKEFVTAGWEHKEAVTSVCSCGLVNRSYLVCDVVVTHNLATGARTWTEIESTWSS